LWIFYTKGVTELKCTTHVFYLKFDTSPLTLLKKQQDSGYCQHQSYGETISYFCPKICDRCPTLAREGGAQLEVFCSGVR
jgi:hypothetical protein